MAEENVTPAASAAPVNPVTTEPSAPAVVVSQSASSPSEVKQPELPLTEPTVLGVDDAPKTEAKVEAKTDEVKTETKPEEKKTEAKVEEKKVETKPEEKKTEAKVEEKKDEAPKVEEKAPEPPTFEWKFPEGVTVDKDRVSEFTKELGEFALTSKADSKLVQELGQKLLDRHVTEMQSVAQKVAEAYDKVWKDQTKSWFDQFVKDPEIGGNKRDTTVNAAREFIRRHGGTEEQQTEIRTIMQKTGLGNHPALIRLFAKATLAMGEPKAFKAEAPPAVPTTLKTKMYGNKKKS